MPTIDQFRALIPNGDKLSDYDIVKEVSRTLEMDPRYIADRLGFEANKPGLISDVKRGTGQVIEALGSTAQDLGLSGLGKAAESYGAGLTFKNPSQINTVEEALRSPWTTTREAVGEVVPQVATSIGTGLAGRVIGGVLGLPFGPAGVAVGQTLGAGAGAYLGNLAQEYGGIRSEQREQGIDDKARALATGGAAAVLDTALGAERIANKFLAKGSDILAREAGTNLGKHVAKQTAIGTGIEAGTEGVQTALERVGAYKDIASSEGLNEIGLAMIKGGIGGGVIRGGLSAVAGERQPEGGSLLGGASQQTSGDIQQAFGQPDINSTPLTTQAPASSAPVTAAPAVSGGTTEIAQAQQQANAENQAAEQAQRQQVARENAFSGVGATYNPEGQGSLSIFGQTILGPQVSTFGNALAGKVSALPPHAVQIANAISQANAVFATPEKPSPLVSFTYNGNNPIGSADKVMKALEKVTEKFQIGHVASVEEAANNLNTLSKNAKGAYLEQLNAIHEALTGRDTDGFIASQESKAAKEGAKNGKLQLQTTTGLGTVPVEGGAGEANGGNAGNVQPSGVQPVAAGSQPEGSLGLQTGQVSGEGIRAGTGSVPGAVGGELLGQGPGQGQVNGQAQTAATGEAGQNVPADTEVRGEGASSTGQAPSQTAAEARVNAARQAWEDMDVSGVSYDNIPAGLREGWERAVAQGTATGEIQEGIANEAIGASQESQASRIVMAVLTKVIQKTSRMDEATAQKKREFIAAYFGGARLDVLTQVAADLGISPDQAKRWSAEMPKFIEKNAGKLRVALMEVSKESGFSIDEMQDALNAKAEESAAGGAVAADTSLEEAEQSTTRSEEPVESDTDVGGELGFMETEREEAPEASAVDENDTNLVVSTRKSASLQEQFNAVETVNAAYMRTVDALDDALDKLQTDPENADLQQEVATLQAKLEKLTADATELAAKNARKGAKESKNAVQESSTEEVPVREGAGGGEAVGEGNAKKPKATRARKAKAEPKQEAKPEEVTPPEVQTPAEQWNALTVLAPELPAYEVLSRDEKTRWDDLAHRGTANLAAAVRLVGEGTQPTGTALANKGATTEGTRGNAETVEGKKLFGKDSAVVNPYTAAELVKDISDFVRSAINTRRLKVVDSIQDLLESADPVEQELGASIALNKAYGVAANGKAYLIANRITKGQGRAKFLHEVGAHIGMEGLLTDEQFDTLTDQIFEWSKRDDGSRESQLAVRAILRADAAGTPDEDLRSEVLAYFVEEAMQAGIEPSAAMKLSGPLGQWFRTLYAAFKSAIRRLGMNPEKLTAQDVVNMAYGAARLEMSGTYHGTAADFRRFNHKYMGTGEGAQAFGWGTYLAQRFGIAKGYWKADVQRKAGAEGGKSLLEQFKEAGIDSHVAFDTYYNHQGEAFILLPKEVSLTAAGDVRFAVKYLDGRMAGRTESRTIYQILNSKGDIAFSDDQREALEKVAKEPVRGPLGNVMRVDVGVEQNELLDWDTKLSEQPELLKKITAGMSPEFREQLEEEVGDSLEDMTGNDFYRGLEFLEKKEGVVSEQFKDVEDYNKRLANVRAKQLVSTYLDEVIGIPGLKFLDAESRVSPAEDIPAYEEAIQQWRDQISQWKADKSLDARTLRDLTKDAEGRIADYERRIAKARQFQPTRNLVIFNDKNIFRVGSRGGNRRENMKFGVDVGIQRLPKPLQSAAGRITTDLLYQAKKGVLASAITEDVVNMASKYMRSAADYLKAQYARQALRLRHELNVEKVLQQYDKLPKELQGTGKGSVNEFIFDSTTTGLWGYYPGQEFVGTSLLNIDKGMEARFNAFPPAAQKLIKDVFAYGNEALRDKQKAVKDAIDREFADREKAAIGDADAMDKIAKDKAKLMKRESRLNNLVNSKPYAYLGRYGDFVMVAKSKEYKHYEELAEQRDPAAIAWIEQNETDPKHYVVEFAETLSEAKAIAERLGATGMYDMPEAFEKEAYADYLGSSDAYVAINRLRKMVSQEFKGSDPDALKSIDKMLGDLYLITAAESSARKSMLQRKDITGADKDMMRNMATSGRANAHFLATLQYNDEIADSINKMRQERKYNNEAATPFFNELLKRHASSMKYETPGPLSSFLTKTTSVWFLATSPAFYLQQLLQTYVLSLPYIAGRLGYFRSARAINAAYKDMAGLVKGISLTDHIDFDKAPADVRGMLQTLVGMGKIDIGVDSDAKARAGERNIANRALQKLQSINTRIESINRATAAIAAYRGYLQRYGKDKTDAATKFAADVVSNTHGSYDGFNTPRIMQSGAGRVAFQFKRFQIIQLSMMAKLISTAFGKSSKEEKAVARKMLGFIGAQMAAIGGVLAVPFVSQVAWILSKALGDDEPEDPEVMLRRWIGDQAVADLILRGATGAAGIESLGKKVGMENVASPFGPYAQIDMTSRAGAEKAMVAMMGASAGLGLKMADALGFMIKGDYYRGLEMAMPNGIGNAMKGYRLLDEGVTRRNKDVVLKPEEISVADAAFQAVGLPTTTITRQQFTQRVVAQQNQYYSDKASEIKTNYVSASKDGDTGAMAEARQEWEELQTSRKAKGYKVQPMSELFQAVAEARKRERGVVGGVETTKANKRFVEEVSRL